MKTFALFLLLLPTLCKSQDSTYYKSDTLQVKGAHDMKVEIQLLRKQNEALANKAALHWFLAVLGVVVLVVGSNK